ncbi:MAG TPA: cellulase family glycosylhydrolase, partial [Tepidisphaeraceae bacterium]
IGFGAEGSGIANRIGPFPAGLGVNIHFADPRPGEMKMLAEAGFTWVRMDFNWGATERKQGEYDFAAYDRLLSALDEYHIHPIFILDYSNRNYDDDQSPHTDEGRAAFARWAAAAATHFKGRGVIWEMYNEPNIGFWKPKPNVDDYAKLALAVGKALREATPDEPYIGPACSTMDFKFLDACFKAGCLEYWSAVSVHPYRQKDPETVAADYAKLRELIKQYAPAGKQIPIISGEWGYSAGWKKFDEARQAKYLPRGLLTNVASGLPISIWYDWHDDGTNASDGEHHFGTVHYEYHKGREEVYDPKPAYVAMKTMADALRGSTFEKRLDVGSNADWVLAFKADDGERFAVWTTGKPHDVKLPAPPGKYRVIAPGQEQGKDATADANGLMIQATETPQYLLKSGR